MPCNSCTHDPRCQDVCQHSSCATGQEPEYIKFCCVDCVGCPKCGVSPSPAHAGICEPETLADALRLVLPMAKGYASANRVGANAEIIAQAESVLRACAAAPDVGKAQAPSPEDSPCSLCGTPGFHRCEVAERENAAAIAQSAPSPVLLEAGKEGQ